MCLLQLLVYSCRCATVCSLQQRKWYSLWSTYILVDVLQFVICSGVCDTVCTLPCSGQVCNILHGRKLLKVILYVQSVLSFVSFVVNVPILSPNSSQWSSLVCNLSLAVCQMCHSDKCRLQIYTVQAASY